MALPASISICLPTLMLAASFDCFSASESERGKTPSFFMSLSWLAVVEIGSLVGESTECLKPNAILRCGCRR
jgi:hypothetical protein